GRRKASSRLARADRRRVRSTLYGGAQRVSRGRARERQDDLPAPLALVRCARRDAATGRTCRHSGARPLSWAGPGAWALLFGATGSPRTPEPRQHLQGIEGRPRYPASAPRISWTLG